jgi:hypothetical protein
MKLNLDDPLHRDVAQMLAAYEQLLAAKHGHAQAAGRTRMALARGVERCLENLTLRRATVGLDMLVEHGLADLTAEALVLKYPHRFSQKAIAAARLKVAAHRRGDMPLPRKARRGRGSY